MKRVAIPLILILGGAVAAQVPASLPASAPAGTQPTPASPSAVSRPTTDAAETAPTTTQAATSEPATSPVPTTGVATTGPTSRPFASSNPSEDSSSYRFSRSNRFGESPTPPTSSYAADTAGMPDLKPKPYPKQYSALLSRSVFIKGRQWVADTGDKDYRPPEPPHGPMPSPGPSPYSPEGVLVFNGASDVDGQLVAFIENTGMNQISRYHVGDPVGQGAQGKIAAITLDGMDYQVGSKITHVLLGQNLYGQETQILTTQPVVTGGSSSGTGTGTGGVGGATTGPASTSGAPGTDSILERLRRRRMQELGQ